MAPGRRRPSLLVVIHICEGGHEEVLPQAANYLNRSRELEFKAQLLIWTLGFMTCHVLKGEKEHRF